MVNTAIQSAGAREIAGDVPNKNPDAARLHLLQEYFTREPLFNKNNQRLLVADGSEPLGDPRRKYYPMPGDHMEEMAQNFALRTQYDVRSETLPSELSETLKGMPKESADKVLDRVRFLLKERGYDLPELPSKADEERSLKPEELVKKATSIKDKIASKDLDGARIDLIESYLKMPQADFVTMSDELKRQTASTSAPFTSTWSHGKLTDASLNNGLFFGDKLISTRANFNAPKPALENPYLEGIAVKYSNLMQDAYRPDSIGQALVRVAQSLPKDEAKLLLNRVMDINVFKLQEQNSHAFGDTGQSPRMTIKFADLDKDGKPDELSGFQLEYSLWSLSGVPIYRSIQGSIPWKFYTGPVDVYTPEMKAK